MYLQIQNLRRQRQELVPVLRNALLPAEAVAANVRLGTLDPVRSVEARAVTSDCARPCCLSPFLHRTR